MPGIPHLRLGVNIDHVATIRNARGGRHPDPVRAALLAIEAGADGITAHLREDRRHIRDDDIARLKAEIAKPLNFEMAATDGDARRSRSGRDRTPPVSCRRGARNAPPKAASTSPAQRADARAAVAELSAAGIRVSLFIAADPRQIEAAAALGAPVIEIHTGAWCEALAQGDGDGCRQRMAAHPRGRAARAKASASKCMPAMGSITPPPRRSRRLPEIVELNIGHFLVGEAVFDGLAACDQDDARGDGPRPRSAQIAQARMILGIGSDLIDIRRIEKVIERHGERFLKRIFTDIERARAERRARTAPRPTPSASPPRRPAPRRSAPASARGVCWRDMGVVNLPSGRPTMAADRRRAASGSRRSRRRAFEARIDLTLTDEYPLAQAFVVISAVPAQAMHRDARLNCPQAAANTLNCRVCAVSRCAPRSAAYFE